MNLHIFNPEHDLVLACNNKSYTPSEGIRSMRSNFSYVPVFWAEPGDVILTDNIDATIEVNKKNGIPNANVIFTSLENLRKYHFNSVIPWGWDKAIKNTLLRNGIEKSLMPSDEQLEVIRNMSHRRNVLPLMQVLRDNLEDVTCGDGIECSSIEDINNVATTWSKIIIKAPWSSSGINIIYVENGLSDALSSRCQHIISKQGSVMIEPIYNKVKDFAMEFDTDGNGNTIYLGLSIFETLGTAYLENITSSESDKLQVLSQFVAPTLLEEIKNRICSYMSIICNGRYQGPFGVDMMIVKQNNSYVIDPCVEINLRRTMGHVAIERWKKRNTQR